jgi:hypothetical protein
MADPDFALPGGAILEYAIAYVSRVLRRQAASAISESLRRAT